MGGFAFRRCPPFGGFATTFPPLKRGHYGRWIVESYDAYDCNGRKTFTTGPSARGKCTPIPASRGFHLKVKRLTTFCASLCSCKMCSLCTPEGEVLVVLSLVMFMRLQRVRALLSHRASLGYYGRWIVESYDAYDCSGRKTFTTGPSARGKCTPSVACGDVSPGGGDFSGAIHCDAYEAAYQSFIAPPLAEGKVVPQAPKGDNADTS